MPLLIFSYDNTGKLRHSLVDTLISTVPTLDTPVDSHDLQTYDRLGQQKQYYPI